MQLARPLLIGAAVLVLCSACSNEQRLAPPTLVADAGKSGLTQEELADLCDFDPTYISLLERGKRNPAFLTIVKISRHLKCWISDLTDV